MHELCKRLDDEHTRCRFVADLFKPQVALLRVKMRDYSLKMWSADPVANGVSAVDLYWRKGLYDTLAAAKNIKQGSELPELSEVFQFGVLRGGVYICLFSSLQPKAKKLHNKLQYSNNLGNNSKKMT